MSKFDMGEYVDVAERERLLFARYPDARIQVWLEDVRDGSGELVAWKCSATIWRTPDDPLPVIDWAVEPVPGRTPFTKDSEAMNASTSAVGRAIVLAGFETKKIASADEVRNRSSEPSHVVGDLMPEGTYTMSAASTFTAPAMQAQASNPQPDDIEVTFGKHKGQMLRNVPDGYKRWLAGDEFEPKTPDQHAVKAAAQSQLGLVPAGFPDDDIDGIPF